MAETGKQNAQIDPVSYDKNWRTRVKNEQQSADQWQQDWGFLVTDNPGAETQKEDALKIYTIDDKIRLAQEVPHDLPNLLGAKEVH